MCLVFREVYEYFNIGIGRQRWIFEKAVRKIGDINRAILLVNKDRSSPYPAGTTYGIRFGAIEGQNNVEGFPEWRKLRRMMEILLYDQCFSSVAVDNMTSLSLRPPEL
eukprot:15334466-Ditylum_brightwellii.AAC.1